jgi:hypothetical protein
VILVIVFCILASFGGGLTVRNILARNNGWTLPAYGFVAGIFVAFSAVIISYVMKSLREN